MNALGKFRIRLRASLVLSALVLPAAALIPAAARAGALHVYSCSDPQTGAALPTAGWGASGNGPTFNTCASQPISGGLGGETIAEFGGTNATWTFTAPSDTQITNAVIYRSALASYRTRAYWTAPESHFAPADSFDVCQGADATHACVLGDTNALASCASPDACYPPTDALLVPSANLPASTVSLDVACLVQGCGGSETMHSSDITLTQDQPPTASAVGGSLASENVLEGEPGIVINASDPGAGIYGVRFIVDGAVTARHALAADDASCNAYAEAHDGTSVFLSPRPCPASVSNVSVPFDTSKVSDGIHQLTVAVEDAAGNAVPVLTRTVAFNNRGEYLIQLHHQEQSELEAHELATRGPCNATCDPKAVFHASKPVKRGGAVRRPYARSALTLEGRLVGQNGAPIPDAILEVTDTLSYRGAPTQVLGRAVTNRSGVWSFVVPRGPSRTIAIAYRTRMKDKSPAAELAWTEVVPTPITLHAPRTVSPNQAFTFRGSTAGGSVPADGLLVSLEIRYAGRWREIALLHAGPHGRFHYSYTFAAVPQATYLFRVAVPRSAVYPFAPGASAVAGVGLR